MGMDEGVVFFAFTEEEVFIEQEVGWGDMAFLNRMGITVGAITLVLLVITLAKPMKEVIKLPEQTKIELNWSKGSVYFGIFVTFLTVILYIIFW